MSLASLRLLDKIGQPSSSSIAVTLSVLLQGRPQDLAGGGQEFSFRFVNLHVAKRHAAHGEAMRFDRVVRGHSPPLKIFFKMVQFGAFWCIF